MRMPLSNRPRRATEIRGGTYSVPKPAWQSRHGAVCTVQQECSCLVSPALQHPCLPVTGRAQGRLDFYRCFISLSSNWHKARDSQGTKYPLVERTDCVCRQIKMHTTCLPPSGMTCLSHWSGSSRRPAALPDSPLYPASTQVIVAMQYSLN